MNDDQNASTSDQDRDPKTGQWLAKNRGAEVHGAVTLARRGDEVLTPELRDSIDAFRSAVLSDLGGEENLTALERGLVQRVIEIQTICALLAQDIARRGVMTASGKQRSSVARLYAGIDRYQRLSHQLGLQRRAKDVSLTIEGYMAKKRAEMASRETKEPGQ